MDSYIINVCWGIKTETSLFSYILAMKHRQLSVCLLLVWGNVVQERTFSNRAGTGQEKKASGSSPVLSHLVCIPIFHLHYWLRYFESFSLSSHNRPIKNIMHYESWHEACLLQASQGAQKHPQSLRLEVTASTWCLQPGCDNLWAAGHKQWDSTLASWSWT